MFRMSLALRFFVLTACLLSLSSRSFAEPEQRSRLEQIKVKVEKESKRLGELSRRADGLSKALTSKRQELKKLQKREAQTARDLKKVELRRTEIRAEIVRIDREIAELEKLSLQRLRSLFIHKKENVLEKVLVSADSSQLVRNTFFYSKIREFDLQVLDTLAGLRIVQKKKKLELDDAVAEQRILALELSDQREEIEDQVQEKNSLIARLKREEKGVQKILAALRAESLRLETVIRSMTGGAALADDNRVSLARVQRNNTARLANPLSFKGQGLDRQRGSLIKPVAGKVIRKYGKYKVSQFSDYVFSKGLEFAAAEGSAVRVIADGRVMYIGKMPGYGNILIIEHGKRYYSLYGCLEEVLVRAGDVLAKGDELALTGKPDLKGKNFYFEIRKNGSPVNPGNFFPRGFRTAY